jgi:hypothetical protein
MKSFAGFWRDGAKVKPEESHWKNRRIVARWKDSEWYEVLSDHFVNWYKVYWLDTTTPTELTPQEAFECLKMLFPMITQIEKDRKRDYTVKGDGYTEANINWGDLTEYPPRKSWRVPTDADKGKKCRVKDKESEQWYESRFLVTDGRRFLARRDEDSYAYPYDFCEVQDDA